ncbi:hypothetical protein [Cupriavidus basilensis]|uniref:Type IV fimbrial biogenesis protein PilX n=1 Tax=Cupriavidus basilensis TaxID=68895 RepID=A0A643G1J9_9BURK|nr:hypothetical protein [Cupriavidus basilensis]QOT75576.1 hypothetical protein F7R26_015490 [Cupriavidus basilensis]
MRSRRTQTGLALPIVLIILLAILVSAVSLLRTGAVSGTTAGNVAFKEAASQATDLALTAAKTTLDGVANPDTTDTTKQYYATTTTFALDQNGLPNVNWADTTSFPQVQVGNGGLQYQYVVERLCSSTPVTDPYGQCTARAKAIQGPSSNQMGSPSLQLPQVAYRVTVHVTSPRSGETFVQAILNR